MMDPVFTCDGHTYERLAIQEWLRDHDTSPNTGEALRHKELTPNIMARGLISAWLQEHPQHRPLDTGRAGRRGPFQDGCIVS
jgi:hypothetical protein